MTKDFLPFYVCFITGFKDKVYILIYS